MSGGWRPPHERRLPAAPWGRRRRPTSSRGLTTAVRPTFRLSEPRPRGSLSIAQRSTRPPESSVCPALGCGAAGLLGGPPPGGPPPPAAGALEGLGVCGSDGARAFQGWAGLLQRQGRPHGLTGPSGLLRVTRVHLGLHVRRGARRDIWGEGPFFGPRCEDGCPSIQARGMGSEKQRGAALGPSRQSGHFPPTPMGWAGETGCLGFHSSSMSFSFLPKLEYVLNSLREVSSVILLVGRQSFSPFLVEAG